jgi:hypothetical protein
LIPLVPYIIYKNSFLPKNDTSIDDLPDESLLFFEMANPVRNSSGPLNPAGIILKSNAAAEQQGIISNGVNSQSFGFGGLVFYIL